MPDEDTLCSVTEQFDELKHKYERLKESHRQLVSVNQNLEEKLLKNIQYFEDEKFSLIHTIKSLDLQLEEVRQLNRILNAENVIQLILNRLSPVMFQSVFFLIRNGLN